MYVHGELYHSHRMNNCVATTEIRYGATEGCLLVDSIARYEQRNEIGPAQIKVLDSSGYEYNDM